ncbi:MAG: hypothetical protein AMJ92_08105 [candidate division Zixibacteria bacterium SM23_81]|nr:MAG: hypothetical protein AMJ92_08105 [candidate division Zixibacteria bacterium SM23_81]
MKIEILGTGCSKCEGLAENVQKALQELGIKTQVSKVTDIQEIASRGVMLTPGLVVDGEVKSAGRVLRVKQIKELLSKKQS